MKTIITWKIAVYRCTIAPKNILQKNTGNESRSNNEKKSNIPEYAIELINPQPLFQFVSK